MNKPIAERFENFLSNQMRTRPNNARSIPKSQVSISLVTSWLAIQPENQPRFSIAEVEQIAREAVAHGEVRFEVDDNDNMIFPKNLHFNEEHWANKLKELSK